MKIAKLWAYLVVSLALPFWLYNLTDYDLQNNKTTEELVNQLNKRLDTLVNNCEGSNLENDSLEIEAVYVDSLIVREKGGETSVSGGKNSKSDLIFVYSFPENSKPVWLITMEKGRRHTLIIVNNSSDSITIKNIQKLVENQNPLPEILIGLKDRLIRPGDYITESFQFSKSMIGKYKIFTRESVITLIIQ